MYQNITAKADEISDGNPFSDPEQMARSYQHIQREQISRKQFEKRIIREVGRRFMRYAVLGTSFEVNAYKFSQTSDVTLVEGKVEILDNNRNSLCTLQPGQQFKIDKRNNHFTLHQVDAEMYASWHGGRLEFDGQTFVEIVKVLERHYDVRIMLANGIAKDIKS